MQIPKHKLSDYKSERAGYSKDYFKACPDCGNPKWQDY